MKVRRVSQLIRYNWFIYLLCPTLSGSLNWGSLLLDEIVAKLLWFSFHLRQAKANTKEYQWVILIANKSPTTLLN